VLAPARKLFVEEERRDVHDHLEPTLSPRLRAGIGAGPDAVAAFPR
jgi:hypothetical protein